MTRVDPANLHVFGTLHAPGYSPLNTIDDDRTTFWHGLNGLNVGDVSYLAYRFVDGPKTIGQIDFFEDYQNQYLMGNLDIQFSNNSTDGLNGSWSTIDTIPDSFDPVSGDFIWEGNIPKAEWVRLWMRYDGEAAHGNSQAFYLSEIDFWEVVDDQTDPDPGPDPPAQGPTPALPPLTITNPSFETVWASDTAGTNLELATEEMTLGMQTTYNTSSIPRFVPGWDTTGDSAVRNLDGLSGVRRPDIGTIDPDRLPHGNNVAYLTDDPSDVIYQQVQGTMRGDELYTLQFMVGRDGGAFFLPLIELMVGAVLDDAAALDLYDASQPAPDAYEFRYWTQQYLLDADLAAGQHVWLRISSPGGASGITYVDDFRFVTLGGNAVPEPATGLLLLIACPIVLRCGRLQRTR